MRGDGHERYQELVARIQAERNGRPITLRLSETATAHNPYVVARTLAVQGLAVFPVRGKQPLTPNGVYSATCDMDKLCRMNWCDADGCGLATGQVNAVDVFDVDVRLWDQQELMGREVPPPASGTGETVLKGFGLNETLMARTPHNGRHFFYRHVAGSRSRSRLGGDLRLEWFSDRKLVVVPPAPERSWLNHAEVAQVPEFLKALVLAPRSIEGGGDGEEGPSGPLVLESEGRDVPRDIYFLILSGMANAKPKVRRRVKGLWRNLAGKQEHRNDCLNYTSWQFSGFVESGELDRMVAARLLVMACRANGYLKVDGPDVVREVISRVLKWQRE